MFILICWGCFLIVHWQCPVGECVLGWRWISATDTFLAFRNRITALLSAHTSVPFDLCSVDSYDQLVVHGSRINVQYQYEFPWCDGSHCRLFSCETMPNVNFEAITNLMHKYLYSYNITVHYMFRELLCSSSGGSIVNVQHLVPSLSVSGRTLHWLSSLLTNVT